MAILCTYIGRNKMKTSKYFMNRKMCLNNKKIYIIVSILLLILLFSLFGQQRYRISFSNCTPDIYNDNIGYLVKLRMNLSEIESEYPGFLPPICTCGEQHNFGDTECEDTFNSLTKLTLSKLLWYLTLKKLPYYDYCNDEHGAPIRCRYFRTLPGEGTYSAPGGGNFLEVNENGLVIVDVHGLKYEISKLRDEFKDYPVSLLKPEHFQCFRSIHPHEKSYTKINLPFGTYLMRFNSISYSIISVLPE